MIDVEEVVPKKGRSAYEVCHGYTMYWVMVAVLATQITSDHKFSKELPRPNR